PTAASLSSTAPCRRRPLARRAVPHAFHILGGFQTENSSHMLVLEDRDEGSQRSSMMWPCN
uniref:Uncharacterized protein n=1 Tax=Aegilops tauschii subsp. strangulata TaxID=200361 RepID=A0A453GCJ7_AEGTS